MVKARLEFTEKSVRDYLDECIRYWRSEENKHNPIAEYYIDAYQSVRVSIFGSLLPGADAAMERRHGDDSAGD